MRIPHSFRYTRPDPGGPVAEASDLELSRLAAVGHALRLLRDLHLQAVEVSAGGWHRQLCPGCFWAVGSGVVVCKLGSSPKLKDSVVRFLAACPGFRETDWCYHFTTQEDGLDGETRLCIDRYVRPGLEQHFNRARAFVFDWSAGPVQVPAWLDAECCPDERAVVFYGLARGR